ncbi:MAG: NAD(P)H-dependent oxidoreductase [Anaerolineales bacterium]|nr:NAD(P)H-dependent oxidoreductase [Anaerolineales bacterium]
MKITILNGNPTRSAFDDYLDRLVKVLVSGNHQVIKMDLRDLSLKYCTGCFDCWTKTPGFCAADEASQEIGRAVINSDFTLWAAPLKMGFPSALMKMAFDKHLPLIHPYIMVDQNESHHLKRYEKYPRVGLLVEKEPDTTGNELEIIRDIFSRTALNFKSKLDFMETTDLDPETLNQKILQPRKGPHFYQKKPAPVRGERITPPGRITVFNGSPRGKKGNTPIMLNEFMKGFGSEANYYDLIKVNDLDQHVQAFENAECVWLGFPLYTDGMPAVVKTFIEALEPFKGKKDNPPIGFLVQSGFPEGVHSRYVERYLAALAARLSSPYLGTIIKGNGEGTRIMPAEMNRGLFDHLNALGRGIAEDGVLDPEILKKTARPEHYPLILGPLFRVFLKTKMAHRYFDTMLVENDAFERKDDRPFAHPD